MIVTSAVATAEFYRGCGFALTANTATEGEALAKPLAQGARVPARVLRVSPGLGGAAVRAGDGRRHGGLEDEAALAAVERLVLRRHRLAVPALGAVLVVDDRRRLGGRLGGLAAEDVRAAIRAGAAVGRSMGADAHWGKRGLYFFRHRMGPEVSAMV
jgi:hypothetical protein